MSGADRSLIFTALLEIPEFARMESRRGSRLVSDAAEHVATDQRLNPTLTLAESMQTYVAFVTASGTTEPGVWERYVDTLYAGDEVRATRAGVHHLPEGMHVVGPMKDSSRD